MNAPLTLLFAGGGTGGHLFPGLAVASELRRRHPDSRIGFIGSRRDIESRILEASPFEHQVLSVEPLPVLRRNPVRFVWGNWSACQAARRLIREWKPAAVIGLGGFASAPVVWVASRQRIPVILLEQNLIPGRTTRWLSRFASQVCTSFEETRARLPHRCQVTVTGNPVSEEIRALARLEVAGATNQQSMSTRRQLLVLGGSQGADSLNEAMLTAVNLSPDFFAEWTIVHQTGPRQVDPTRRAYQELGITAEVAPFFHDLPARYAAARIVISRAGATTLAELTCVARPMILLPYPQAADNHQQANAQYHVDHGCAVMIEHAASAIETGRKLEQAFRDLASHPDRQTSMSVAAKRLAHPDAAPRIADAVESTIKSR